MMAAMWHDVRYAIRGLLAQPAFAAVAIATLVLGIGANTAIFSVANAVLFRPLNVPDEERLVRVGTAFSRTATPMATLPHFNVLREQGTLFDALAAHRLDFLNIGATPEPEPVPVARVTASFFRMFGAPVMMGRAFTDAEDRPGGGR